MAMPEPIIVCPQCQSEIKLTESLAAPLLESTRQQFEQRLADQETRVQAREAAIKKQQQELAQAQVTLEEQVAAKLNAERANIAAEEAKKARVTLALDLDQKSREIADLQEVLKARNEKLEEAQKAQAELLRNR